MPKDTRWKYEKDNKIRANKSPGPGKYECRTEFSDRKRKKRNGFGKVQKMQTITYYKELQKAYTSLYTPGPGEYVEGKKFNAKS